MACISALFRCLGVPYDRNEAASCTLGPEWVPAVPVVPNDTNNTNVNDFVGTGAGPAEGPMDVSGEAVFVESSWGGVYL